MSRVYKKKIYLFIDDYDFFINEYVNEPVHRVTLI